MLSSIILNNAYLGGDSVSGYRINKFFYADFDLGKRFFFKNEIFIHLEISPPLFDDHPSSYLMFLAKRASFGSSLG